MQMLELEKHARVSSQWHPQIHLHVSFFSVFGLWMAALTHKDGRQEEEVGE